MKNDTIETLRHSLGITKKEFAERLDITPTSYTKYIQGVRDIPSALALKMKNDYNISIDWLLTGRGAMRLDEHDKLLGNIASISKALHGSDEDDLIISDDTKKLIALLQYAPPQFIKSVITKLETFKNQCKV